LIAVRPALALSSSKKCSLLYSHEGVTKKTPRLSAVKVSVAPRVSVCREVRREVLPAKACGLPSSSRLAKAKSV
jgi:hypothetical protein